MYILIIWSMGFISRPLLSPFLVHKLESFPHFRTFFLYSSYHLQFRAVGLLTRPACGHLLIWCDQPVVAFWSDATSLQSPSDLVFDSKTGTVNSRWFSRTPSFDVMLFVPGDMPSCHSIRHPASVQGKREYCRMTIKKYPGHSAHRAEVVGLWFRGWNRF